MDDVLPPADLCSRSCMSIVRCCPGHCGLGRCDGGCGGSFNLAVWHEGQGPRKALFS
jgi:hypothetical protein